MSSAALPPSALITVTSGADRGHCFQLVDDLVHIGRGPDNQIVLNDSMIDEHQLSIVCRNGRYAVFTPQGEQVEVEGNKIPPQRWVWLPSEASIKLSKLTTLWFQSAAEASPDSNRHPKIADISDAETPQEAEQNMVTTASSRGTSSHDEPTKKKRRNVARFITDDPAESMIKLGDDGHLPELALEIGEERNSAEKSRRTSNPLVLVGVFGLSLCAIVLILLTDFEDIHEGSRRVAAARQRVAELYGKENQPLHRFQIHLREAQQAHSRGNRAAEQRHFREVLKLLRAESKNAAGLTGKGWDADKSLEGLIAIILSDN